jgi:hypothetical protein
MIAFQPDFRPPLPNVYGASDYREFRDHLVQIDQLLRGSRIEERLVGAAMDRWEQQAKKDGVLIKPADQQRQWRSLHYALRCNVARHLTGESFRHFSIRLADSSLLQWFTGISDLEHRKAASKSSLERYDKCFEVHELEEAIRSLIGKVCDEQSVAELLGREKAVSLEDVFADCTCVKANIHFPVDWVLLRDAARTLIAAIKLIRAQGLKHRMPEPSSFVKRMNQLCMEMTHARRRKDSKKQRKRVLRKMKKLARTIEKHAERYRDLLASNGEKTDWSEAQIALVLGRINHVLGKLPAAIRQAHERIIGERQLENKEKMLSLYEEDVHVLVRGKAGAEVEFGNGLYLAEQQDGLIVDWKLFKDQPPADTKLVKQSLERMEEAYGPIGAYCADRGFDARANAQLLDQKDLYNAICPKDPTRMAERREELRFIQLQNRRAQTEGRIAIFKNAYLGRPLRSKGFEHKENTMVWCVLTHNLWVLARMALAEEQEREAA